MAVASHNLKCKRIHVKRCYFTTLLLDLPKCRRHDVSSRSWDASRHHPPRLELVSSLHNLGNMRLILEELIVYVIRVPRKCWSWSMRVSILPMTTTNFSKGLGKRLDVEQWLNHTTLKKCEEVDLGVKKDVDDKQTNTGSFNKFYDGSNTGMWKETHVLRFNKV